MDGTGEFQRTPVLIALDWGTSSCRAWLLGPGRTVLEARHSGAGTLEVSGRGDSADPASRAANFEAAFLQMCGDWLSAAPDVRVLASGMVGSNQGWQEAEYVHLPSDIDSICARLTKVHFAGGELSIVPGLFFPGDPATGMPPDVIRGEEVQILGVLAETPEGSPDRLLVMPGTHTKWVHVQRGVVRDFVTAMTGEVFGLMMSHSIVGRLATDPPAGRALGEAFERGLAAATDLVPDRGLAAALFTGRTLVMGGRLRPDEVSDYLSGLLIGDEVNHVLGGFAQGSGQVSVCGSTGLSARYSRALEVRGVHARVAPEDVTVAGLWSLARSAGMIETDAVGAATAKASR